MKPENIEARDIPDAWFQCVYKVLDEGRVFTIDRGSYAGHKRLEFDYITIHIKHPNSHPLVPQIGEHYGIPNPVADDYLDGYMPYLMTDEIKPNEAYTYGQRICGYEIPDNLVHDPMIRPKALDEYDELLKLGILQYHKGSRIINGSFEQWYTINQMELLIWTYKNKGHRNNQMVLQVAHPSDMFLKDPPCLRHIDTRIQNGKLHFVIYFRSWDLWNGLPANLAAIQLMKEYMAAEIGVEDGEMIASSKGLHLYDYVFDLGKVLTMKQVMKLKGE